MNLSSEKLKDLGFKQKDVSAIGFEKFRLDKREFLTLAYAEKPKPNQRQLILVLETGEHKLQQKPFAMHNPQGTLIELTSKFEILK